MDNNNLLIFWSIMVIVALSLDALAYFVLQNLWKKHGVILTDMFSAHISDRLRQRVKAWWEKLPTMGKPKLVQAQSNPAPLPDEPAAQVVPASVMTDGQLRQVEFSMEMPLNTTADIHIGATAKDGVKVEQREL